MDSLNSTSMLVGQETISPDDVPMGRGKWIAKEWEMMQSPSDFDRRSLIDEGHVQLGINALVMFREE